MWTRALSGDADTDHTNFEGEFHISPDEHWILREEKYLHTILVACLYKRHGEADYRPASSLRFDEAAWRYYASVRGWRRSEIPSVWEGPRIIDLNRRPGALHLFTRHDPFSPFLTSVGPHTRQRWQWTGAGALA